MPTASPATDQPIRVSPNGRYFVDAAGQPFFWLGDTAWPLYTTYSKEEAERYLADRGRRGFTVIQSVVAWGDPEPAISLAGTPPGPNYAGHLPWHGSPAQPNPTFFEHVDHLVRVAREHGLIMGMLPTWGFHVNNANAFTEETAFTYAQWVGTRYRNEPNIVWINGGDRDPSGRESIWRALGAGLRAGDGGAHLITYHPCGWRSSAYFFHDDAWLDFNMIETWTEWTRVHPAVAADYNLQPAKPVVLGEGAYENGPEYPMGPITPLIVRRQAWWAFTAGGFFTYGQDQMWRMAAGWTDTFDTPGARHMTLVKRIANSRPWWKMVPDQSLIANTPGSERLLNTSLRAKDRSGALIYLSSQCQALIFIDRIATRNVKATWVNPQTGEEKEGGVYATGNQLVPEVFPKATKQWFAVPDFWEDAVLLLDGLD